MLWNWVQYNEHYYFLLLLFFYQFSAKTLAIFSKINIVINFWHEKADEIADLLSIFGKNISHC
jgi:hypothetical protein